MASGGRVARSKAWHSFWRGLILSPKLLTARHEYSSLFTMESQNEGTSIGKGKRDDSFLNSFDLWRQMGYTGRKYAEMLIRTQLSDFCLL